MRDGGRFEEVRFPKKGKSEGYQRRLKQHIICQSQSIFDIHSYIHGKRWQYISAIRISRVFSLSIYPSISRADFSNALRIAGNQRVYTVHAAQTADFVISSK